MEELTLADYFAILRRWKKLFAFVVAVFFILSFAYAVQWKNYRSAATVQIEQSEISATATAVPGNAQDQIQALADQRISSLQQKVLSIGSLIEVITKFNLYPALRETTPIAEVAAKMHKKIKLQLVSSTLANPSAANKQALSAIAFTLSFDYSDPLVTQQVTDELVSRFLDEDLKDRRAEAQQTSAFLGVQIAALEASLSEQEKKIAEFQKEQGVTRPENLAFNQQLVATLTLNMQSLSAQIATNEGTLGTLRGQLASADPYSRVVADGQLLTTPSVQLKALQSQYATLTAQYGSQHPDVAKVRRQIEALRTQVGRGNKTASRLKAQIVDTRTNLDAAEKTYGPDHPDVVGLKNKLQKLEDQLANEKGGNAAQGVVDDADNPAYLQLVAQLSAAQEQHKALTKQREDLQAQIEKYQTALIQNPAAQQALAELSRDYDNSQLRYRELREKKMAADMVEQMQRDRTGERLTLINPPELPLGTQPRRLILLMAGIMLSAMAGFGSVFAAQLVNQSIVGMRHLETVVGVAPLVAIPHIYTRDEKKNSWAWRVKRLAYLFITSKVVPYYERFDPQHERFEKLYDWVAKRYERYKSITQP
jgi:uncharacterized protein involved in exopolysaccharide biosynthesis